MARIRQGLCIRRHEVSNHNIGLVHCPGNTRSPYRGKLQYKPLESPIECIRAMMNYTSLVQTVSNDASAMALVRVSMDKYWDSPPEVSTYKCFFKTYQARNAARVKNHHAPMSIRDILSAWDGCLPTPDDAGSMPVPMQ